MVENLNTLRQKTSLYQIVTSRYYQDNFVKKYIDDIPRMALDLFGVKVTHQQVEIFKTHQWKGGMTLVPSGHSCSKTHTIGILAACFMLLFPMSIVRIQAPRSKQVTNFSFKEIKSNINNLAQRHKTTTGKPYISEWSFLTKFFIFTESKIYIKGHSNSWYIEAVSAPKGEPTNLSGQHNNYYLLIFDEMSGIPDSHITGSLGGASETINSVIGFSQHTELSGKFHEFVENQNKDVGGVWDIVRLNSEESPRVSRKNLKAWRATYDDNEYNVRVLGLKPLFDDDTLINTANMVNCYNKDGKDWLKKPFYSCILSTDVAFSGNYDSSVIVSARLRVELDENGKEIPFVIIDKIQVFQGKNKVRPTRLVDLNMKELHEYTYKNHFKDFQLITDATSGGDQVGLEMQDAAIESEFDVIVHRLKWGAPFKGITDGGVKYTKRTKAYMELKRCIDNGRFYMNTEHQRTRVMQEMTKIPYKFTGSGYKIMEKHEMKAKGLHSPDIADTFAQVFLSSFISYEDSEYDGNESYNEFEEVDDEYNDNDNFDDLMADLI